MCRATRGKSAPTRTRGDGRLETSVPGERPNEQPAAVLAHIIERIDAIDVDQARGAGEPKIHRRHEALSASKDLSFLTVSGKQIERIVNRAGRKIFERNGFHQQISSARASPAIYAKRPSGQIKLQERSDCECVKRHGREYESISC